ncbi:hypothetical protein V1506DRAFT_532250 [Lipomyces tetrasporus]
MFVIYLSDHRSTYLILRFFVYAILYELSAISAISAKSAKSAKSAYPPICLQPCLRLMLTIANSLTYIRLCKTFLTPPFIYLFVSQCQCILQMLSPILQ